MVGKNGTTNKICVLKIGGDGMDLRSLNVMVDLFYKLPWKREQVERSAEEFDVRDHIFAKRFLDVEFKKIQSLGLSNIYSLCKMDTDLMPDKLMSIYPFAEKIWHNKAWIECISKMFSSENFYALICKNNLDLIIDRNFDSFFDSTRYLVSTYLRCLGSFAVKRTTLYIPFLGTKEEIRFTVKGVGAGYRNVLDYPVDYSRAGRLRLLLNMKVVFLVKDKHTENVFNQIIHN